MFLRQIQRGETAAIRSPGGYIHHDNISASWGTPCSGEHRFLGCIPSAGISMEDGEALTAGLIQEFTGARAKPYIPMIRGGDQSFWGVRIPINIMFKYEPRDEDRVSPCPSGGPWWHTDQDTIDKLDRDILLRDARINGKLACLILNAQVLPVQIGTFLDKMERFLTDIQAGLSEEFELSGTIDRVRALVPLCGRLEEKLGGMAVTESDRIIKRVAGELARLTYTSGSPYQHDRSTPYQPFGILAGARGKTWENTPEELYVFEMTQFRRACNRIKGQLAVLAEEMEGTLSYS